MDIEFCGRRANDGLVERLQNLGRKSCPCDSTDRIAGIVRKAKLVLVGTGSELEQDIRGEEIGGIDGRIVNGCHINKVIDCAN